MKRREDTGEIVFSNLLLKVNVYGDFIFYAFYKIIVYILENQVGLGFV